MRLSQLAVSDLLTPASLDVETPEAGVIAVALLLLLLVPCWLGRSDTLDSYHTLATPHQVLKDVPSVRR